jgi:hypothetical protein
MFHLFVLGPFAEFTWEFKAWRFFHFAFAFVFVITFTRWLAGPFFQLGVWKNFKGMWL